MSDLSSLALPDSPELKEIEDRVEAYYDDQRNQILESAEQFAADIGTLLDYIAKHLLTAEEAGVFVERADADLQDRQPAPFAWAYRSTFESGLAKLRRLSGSSRGEEK